MIPKMIRDSKVAVLFSPGFGAGWSTWMGKHNAERAVFDPDLVRAVLGESDESPLVVAERNFPDSYAGGVSDLVVTWIPVGTPFDIHEYDGSESVEMAPTPDYIA